MALKILESKPYFVQFDVALLYCIKCSVQAVSISLCYQRNYVGSLSYFRQKFSLQL